MSGPDLKAARWPQLDLTNTRWPRLDLKTTRWPRPGDPAAAARVATDLAALDPRAAALVAAEPDLVAALGGNSPYLGELARHEFPTLCDAVAEGPGLVLRQVLDGLAATPPASSRARIASALRAAKRRAALCIALADIGGAWSVEQVTGALSDLAEATLRLATAHLLHTAHAKGELRLAHPEDPERQCGFTILGMGKLGAHELNYSSDIDLILLYDPERHHASGTEDGGRAAFTRLARALLALMSTRDAEGYVFRTDLRLRPDPSATPPAISLPAALSYYESMGQGWERAAMIKARPVGGDDELGAQFLDAIRPFIWRRHLDFAALADLQGMKARIDAHKGSRLPTSASPASLAGYDLKLGQGGIREIEFVAQALQMVWGGPDPSLRLRATLPALAALARAGRLPEEVVPELTETYHLLRTAEHRLQMVDDRQTHSLPTKPEEFERFASFLGHNSGQALAEALLPHLARVHAQFSALFSTTPSDDNVMDLEVRTEDMRDRLAAMGFQETERIRRSIEGWRIGRLRALRSERARDLLRQVMPRLLAALARQPDPDVAFTRFDDFLSRLPAGIQLLSLFQRNPALLDRVAAVLGAAPALAEHLSTNPAALEGLLGPEAPLRMPLLVLERQLADAGGLEEAFAITSRFVRAEEFRLSVALMENRLDVDEAAQARSALADAAIAALLPRVMREFSARNGFVPGGALAVVAMGKAGSREMLPGSDLDLMLIYDHPEGVTESTGKRALSASTWFIRAAHAVIAAITAPGTEGKLYEVDMRLRPSGNKGPVAVSLTAFRRYHAEEAWTWERMALTRARVVAGPSALRRRVRQALAIALVESGPEARIRADAAAMRARLAREMPPAGPWDVKLRPGGLMEVEFIAQVLQLIAAPTHPALPCPTTRNALARLADAGFLEQAEAADLIRADRAWRTVQGIVRLAVGHGEVADGLPPIAAGLLCRALATDLAPELHGTALDASALLATLDTLADRVRAAFIRHVGRPEGEHERAGRR